MCTLEKAQLEWMMIVCRCGAFERESLNYFSPMLRLFDLNFMRCTWILFPDMFRTRWNLFRFSHFVNKCEYAEFYVRTEFHCFSFIFLFIWHSENIKTMQRSRRATATEFFNQMYSFQPVYVVIAWRRVNIIFHVYCTRITRNWVQNRKTSIFRVELRVMRAITKWANTNRNVPIVLPTGPTARKRGILKI